MRKYLFGLPTIAMSGFAVAFFWGVLFKEVPADARPELPSTAEAINGFRRIRENMPNMDTFLGIRAVFKQINRQLGNGK